MLLRAAAAIPLIHAGLLTTAAFSPVLGVAMVAAAILLLIGLWTPIAGAFVAVAQLALAVVHPAAPWTFVHSAALGAALALLGPGGWSLDARLFGRRRIEIPHR